MRIWSKIIATLVLCLPASLSFASPPGSYEVSAKLTHGGQAFAAPSAVVLANKPASIEVTGPDGYKLTLTVTDLAPDKIQVAAHLDSAYGSMAPTVVVRPDKSASVSVGDLGLELTVSRGDG
ncbi:hypothetical protein [Solilutibacter oculi]|uniref:hypothetical protein n=1 Tax=Solilutibacter oculi TaxID=2698682 RepID=UPI0013A67E04|nr:hypothetical protein [Lysobacter oculi]